MTAIRSAVSQTLAYSRHFSLPLTPEKIHLWLISSQPVPPARLKPFFPHLSSGEKQLISQRLHISQKKHAVAQRLAGLLSLFPTIRLIATTGSLAVDNAQKDDDLDFFIVTTADTLWLTRPLVILFLKTFGLRRPTGLPQHRSSAVSNKVCDNLWLDETALALPPNKRNLYTAHEVLQARPLFDRGDTYARFLQANSWTKKYLANAYKQATLKGGAGAMRNMSEPYAGAICEEFRERIFCARRTAKQGPLFDTPNRLTGFLNNFAFRLQYHYMKRKITRETITLHSAYFHPNDFGIMELDG